MLLSLLKVVCIAVMGVGVRNTPTPIYIKEDTESQKQINLNENDINIHPQKTQSAQYGYSIPLNFNIATTSVSTGSQASQYSFINRNVFQTNDGYDRPIYTYWVNSAKKLTTNNTIPFTTEMIQKESRIVGQMDGYRIDPSLDGVIHNTRMSTSNFYNNWQYSAWSTKVTTQVNTVIASLHYQSQFDVLVGNWNVNAYGMDKTWRITTKAFIGTDADIQTAHNDLVNQTDHLNETYSYLQQRIANYQIITKTYDIRFQITPQESKEFKINLENTYNIALNTESPTIVTEFTKIEMLNPDENLFNDRAFDIWWRSQNETEPTSHYYDSGQAQLQSYINFTSDYGGYFNATYANIPIVTEVVDIPGMMWQILSMPFTFISTAFNLTLFPGTPYQVNISNLLLTIIGVLVFVFIFKLILKK